MSQAHGSFPVISDVSSRPASVADVRPMCSMALFPVGAEVLFVQEDLWVPVVRCGPRKNVCLLPGVPSVSLRADYLRRAHLARAVGLRR